MFSTSDLTGRFFCLRVVFALIFSGISFQGSAQTPFSWSSDPQHVRDQDTISLHYQVTLQSPGDEVSFVHDLDTWSVASGCTPIIDLSGSWFCEDGLCNASCSINEDRNEITVSITRPSTDPVVGSGQILTLKGVEILIDDDWLRKAIQPVPSVRIFPNPVSQFLMIEWLDQLQNQSVLIRIYNDLGEELRREVVATPLVKLSVDNLPPGRYWVTISSSGVELPPRQFVVVEE